MPPRKSTAALPTATDEEDADFEQPLHDEEGSIPNPYPAQAYRTVRKHHTLQPAEFGQVVAYRFIDVLDMAYQMGFSHFEPPDIQVIPGGGPDGDILAVVTVGAVFVDEEGNSITNYGIGDASPSNCNARVGKHFVRMAETRAQGRALSRAMNLKAVLADELADENDSLPSPRPAATSRPQAPRAAAGGSTKAQQAENPAFWPPFNNEDGDGFVCEITGVPVSGKTAYWSMDKYGQIICWDEQQKRLQAKV